MQSSHAPLAPSDVSEGPRERCLVAKAALVLVSPQGHPTLISPFIRVLTPPTRVWGCASASVKTEPADVSGFWSGGHGDEPCPAVRRQARRGGASQVRTSVFS
jgi:hypothetical protein